MDVPIVSKDVLKKRMEENQNFLLIDVLGADSFFTKHIKGAIHIDGMRQDFVRAVQDIVKNADTEIIVYCASPECLASKSAALTLLEAGFPNVLDYEGGLTDWSEAGYPMEGSSVNN